MNPPSKVGPAEVRPLLVGPRNCEAVTGLPWRHVRDHYRHLAREIGRKLVVPADALLAALRDAPQPPSNDAAEPADPAEAVRRSLRLRRRT